MRHFYLLCAAFNLSAAIVTNYKALAAINAGFALYLFGLAIIAPEGNGGEK